MPSLITEHICTLCEKPGARACARCKSSHYCSKECQVDDWSIHKLLCASFSTFDMSTRPSKTHLRAIVFPQDQPKPQVTWIDCPWQDNIGDGVRWQNPNEEPFLGSVGSTVLIQTDSLLQKRLQDTVSISYRDTFLVDGSKPNKSIVSILATLPGQSHDWRGPIVAIGKQGVSFDPSACRDLDMSDFRYICDHLISYGRWSLDIHSFRMPSERGVVKGVRINCLGDRQVFGKPHYEPVDVPLIDPVFDDLWHDTSGIADRIGLPILTRRCPPSLRWTREKGQHRFGNESPYNNQDATFLHLCCDPNANGHLPNPSCAWAGWQWQSHVGSVIVVRRDKKPLRPMDVQALCQYCRYEVRPLMAHTLGEYAPDKPLSKDFVLEFICRPTFSICWYKMWDQKHKEGIHVPTTFPHEV